MSRSIFHVGVLWWQHFQDFSEPRGAGGALFVNEGSVSLLRFVLSVCVFGDMLFTDFWIGASNFDKNNPNKTPEKTEARIRRRPSGSGEF